MPFTILFPDSRSDELDLERGVAGPDTKLLNPHKSSFTEIDRAA